MRICWTLGGAGSSPRRPPRAPARTLRRCLPLALVLLGACDGEGGGRALVDGGVLADATPSDLGAGDLAPPDGGPPDLGAEDLAIGRDSGSNHDLGATDSGADPDLCTDPDLSPGDQGVPDQGVPDQGAPDQGAPDQGVPDQGAPDQGAPDQGAPDQGVPDLGGDGGEDGGGHVDGGDPADGGGDVESDLGQPLAFCDGPVRLRYDPLGTGELDTFPDDLHTVADPTTATGRRVVLGPETMPGLARLSATVYQSTFRALAGLDGFGTTAGIFFRFEQPVTAASLPPLAATASPESSVVLVELGEAGPRLLPFEWKLVEEGRGLILHPRVPLRPATPHLVAVTRRVEALGQCLAPSRVTVSLLQGRVGASLQAQAARYATGVAALQQLGAIGRMDELSGLTVFTTQSVVDESVAIAGWIARSTPQLLAAQTSCREEPAAGQRRCTLAFEAATFLGEDRVLAPFDELVEPARYRLLAELFLPLQAGELGQAPYPVVLFGHGLGGDRGQAALLAEKLSPLGVATVALDAVAHGAHPTRRPELEEGDVILDFFGLYPGEDRFVPLALRDAWRQSTYDKLQLLRLLLLGVDLDADGQPDVDAARVAYFGVSLGGIMGSEFLALAPAVELGILVVAGGRVTSIVQDASDFEVLSDALQPPGVGEGDLARLLPVLQTVIERGDSANYAPYVLGPPLLARSRSPHLLAGIVIGDTVVPNSSNAVLARALDVPYIPSSTAFHDIGLPLGPPPPVTGNREGGLRTAGLLEFDEMAGGQGLVPATHGGIAGNRVGIEAWVRFLRGWLTDGLPVIVDPYVTLGYRQ